MIIKVFLIRSQDVTYRALRALMKLVSRCKSTSLDLVLSSSITFSSMISWRTRAVFD